jgi:PcfJ-like protein
MEVIYVITVRIPKYQGYEYFCECGYYVDTKFFGNFKCPNCDNEKVLYLDRRYKTKQFYTPIEVVDKGLKYFYLKRKRVKIFFDYINNKIQTKEVGRKELLYNLVDKKCVMIENGKEKEASYGLINNFFGSSNMSDVLDLISIDENRELFAFAINRLSYIGYGEYKRDVGKGLLRLISEQYCFLEIMFFSGYNNEQLYDLASCSNDFNTSGKKPHEILDCSKIVAKSLRGFGELHTNEIQGTQQFFEKYGGNNLAEITEIIRQETVTKNISLHSLLMLVADLKENYGYNNFKKLMTYVCRDVKLQQGIDHPIYALQYLRDYVKMMKELGYEYEKYPKSLKKVHDVASMNYKIYINNKINEDFMEMVNKEEYKKLEYKTKTYSIVLPNESNDLIREGESLNHCVASYIKDVVNGICKILFMRKTDNIEKSKITIEVRGNKIVQAKGYSNRRPTYEEDNFIKEWASQKGLVISNY